MKELIKHLWHENKDEIVSKSLFNCHCVGLHSIMLIDKPEQRVRLFIAADNHELWKNDAKTKEMTIAFHSHHCNVTLNVIKGTIKNWTIKESPMGIIRLYRYKYTSQITDKQISFIEPKIVRIATISETDLVEGSSKFLFADDIHTVCVSKNSIAAWFVYEGLENEQCDNLVYSNVANLNDSDFSKLYQPINLSFAQTLLESVGLL